MTAICMTNDLLAKLLYFLPITTRVRISPPAMVESGLVTRIMAPLSRRHCSSALVWDPVTAVTTVTRRIIKTLYSVDC